MCTSKFYKCGKITKWIGEVNAKKNNCDIQTGPSLSFKHGTLQISQFLGIAIFCFIRVMGNEIFAIYKNDSSYFSFIKELQVTILFI